MVDYENEYATGITLVEEDFIVEGEDGVPQVYVGLNSERVLSFDVAPFGTTEKVMYRIANGGSDLLRVNRRGSNQLEIKSTGKQGEVYFEVFTRTGIDLFSPSLIMKILFGDIQINSLKVLGPRVTGENSKVKLEVEVTPSYATEKVYAKTVYGEACSVEQLDNKTFLVNGLKEGKDIIKFYVKRSFGVNITYLRTIESIDFSVQDSKKLSPLGYYPYYSLDGIEQTTS